MTASSLRSKTRRRAAPVKAMASTVGDALRVLVGGVNSPVRAFKHVGGDPLILARGCLDTVIDQDGGVFLDFIMGWGALILGHNHPAVVLALRRALSQGILLGLTNPLEVALANLIVQAVPSVEQVRFAVSGTEACMTAIRLARAATGRTKILTFDGCYHGHSDSVMAGKTAGIPSALAGETVTVPFNDFEALESALRREGDALACVIIEPVAANMGVIAPEPGVLSRVRALTESRGILLIFDEVVTGFRVGPGGAQALFGIRPDLTTFGKIIGGGLPIGAIGGPRRLMQRLTPEGDVYHGGTFAGHPLTMAAGVAALSELRKHPPYRTLEARAGWLAQQLSDAASRCDVPIQVNRVGSMWTVFFSRRPIRAQADAQAADRARFVRWAQALRRDGILVPPSPFEALFLSTAHTEAHLKRFVNASRAAFRSFASGPA